MLYACNSSLLWSDAAGRVHNISQAQGIEQGDLLAPALFTLGQQDSLVAAQARLRPDEVLAAFLDDLYVVTSHERAREVCDVVSGAVQHGAGVSANLGKTRVFHAAGGEAPPGIQELGDEVWRGDKPPVERGFLALGVPIRHKEFIDAQADIRSVWLLFLFCVAPRAQHLLRNLSPSLVAGHAAAERNP